MSVFSLNECIKHHEFHMCGVNIATWVIVSNFFFPYVFMVKHAYMWLHMYVGMWVSKGMSRSIVDIWYHPAYQLRKGLLIKSELVVWIIAQARILLRSPVSAFLFWFRPECCWTFTGFWWFEFQCHEVTLAQLFY